ncbi:MAG TPA: hypothetical protein VK163_16800 [Opitutaceae bacterium]|nr:hypothetical protein [Opitutaceae bacterium]
MNWWTLIRLAVLCGAITCAGADATAGAPRAERTPFKFDRLNVENSCFVDSVRFADTYLGGRESKGSRWVRVLRWGNLAEDDAAGPGHAVAVFQWRGALFVYDINFGVRRLSVPAARREDRREVEAAVFSLYPQFKQIGAALLDDSWTTRRPALLGTDDGPVTPSYRDAYRVAKILSKQREVRLVRFSYRDKKGERRESAATVFLFDRRLCVYVPEHGTMVQKQVLPAIDDDVLIRARLRRCFGAEADIQFAAPEAVARSANPAEVANKAAAAK